MSSFFRSFISSNANVSHVGFLRPQLPLHSSMVEWMRVAQVALSPLSMAQITKGMLGKGPEKQNNL